MEKLWNTPCEMVSAVSVFQFKVVVRKGHSVNTTGLSHYFGNSLFTSFITLYVGTFSYSPFKSRTALIFIQCVWGMCLIITAYTSLCSWNASCSELSWKSLLYLLISLCRWIYLCAIEFLLVYSWLPRWSPLFFKLPLILLFSCGSTWTSVCCISSGIASESCNELRNNLKSCHDESIYLFCFTVRWISYDLHYIISEISRYL